MTRLTVISLGAGVQSSTMALMAAAGALTPMPNAAIFADTQDEPQAVYEYLHWLMQPGTLPFPVYVVSLGQLSAEIIAAARGESRNDARPPFFIRNPDGTRGILRRQCTQDYKLDVIRRHTRKLLGVGPHALIPAGTVEQWIGFSADEIMRVKPSRQAYITNRFPLIERKVTRAGCLDWLKENGYPTPPKSACVFCPYRSDAEWARMQRQAPGDFARACEVDRIIRTNGYVGSVGTAYVHASLRPLETIDFAAMEAKRVQAKQRQPDLFVNECEGMCGL